MVDKRSSSQTKEEELPQEELVEERPQEEQPQMDPNLLQYVELHPRCWYCRASFNIPIMLVNALKNKQIRCMACRKKGYFVFAEEKDEEGNTVGADVRIAKFPLPEEEDDEFVETEAPDESENDTIEED